MSSRFSVSVTSAEAGFFRPRAPTRRARHGCQRRQRRLSRSAAGRVASASGVESWTVLRQRALSRLPVADRGSDASIRSRLRAALDDNQRLREDNVRLGEELALAHGRLRELELDRRTGRR